MPSTDAVDTISVRDLSEADLLPGQEGLILQRLLWWTIVPQDSPLVSDGDPYPFFEICKRLQTIRQPIGWKKVYNPMTETNNNVPHSNPLTWLQTNLKPNLFKAEPPKKEVISLRYSGDEAKTEERFKIEEARYQERLTSEISRIRRVIERIMEKEHDKQDAVGLIDPVTGMTIHSAPSYKFSKKKAIDFLHEAIDRLVNNEQLSSDFVVAEKLLMEDAIKRIDSILPSKIVEEEVSNEDISWALDHEMPEDDEALAA